MVPDSAFYDFLYRYGQSAGKNLLVDCLVVIGLCGGNEAIVCPAEHIGLGMPDGLVKSAIGHEVTTGGIFDKDHGIRVVEYRFHQGLVFAKAAFYDAEFGL